MQKPSKPERDPYEVAIDYLARREHSQRELRDKLSRKGYNEREVRAAIERLASAGLQSDSRFVEASIQSKVMRGIGPLRVQFEVQRLVDDETLVSTTLEEMDVDWLQLAREAYEKKFKQEQVADYKEKARRMRFLHSRGFSSDIIQRVVE